MFNFLSSTTPIMRDNIIGFSFTKNGVNQAECKVDDPSSIVGSRTYENRKGSFARKDKGVIDPFFT